MDFKKEREKVKIKNEVFKMNKYMRMAINEARKGIRSGHGGPFGAVIVKDGVVVGKGHNQVLKNNDPTCHGEMMAIHKACKKLGTYVFRQWFYAQTV